MSARLAIALLTGSLACLAAGWLLYRLCDETCSRRGPRPNERSTPR